MPHSRSLLRVARRLSGDPATAEDLVQETLLRAWRGFDQFRPNSNVRAWLFRILFNAFYAQGRKARSAPVLVALPSGSNERKPQGRADSVLFEGVAVARALEGLSEEHRAVLLLAVVEGFTCRETAVILSLPVGTVMSRLSRARQTLRAQLSPPAPSLFGAHPSIEYSGKEAV